MKKLAVLVSALCFVFVGCNCNAPATEPTTEDSTKCEGKKECCQMTEEQKADMEAWNDWDNQTAEKQAELVAKRKACIDKKMAEKAEKCDATKEEQCPEKKAKCEEMKAKWDKWETLTIDEQKALLDEMKCCGKKKCCKEGDKKECEKKCEDKK